MIITTQPGAKNETKGSAENNDGEDGVKNSAEIEKQNRAINSAENEAGSGEKNSAEVHPQSIPTVAKNETGNGARNSAEDWARGGMRALPRRPSFPYQQMIPDLQPLIPLEGVIIEQKIELFEVFFGFETENKYEVKTLFGMPLFHLAEKSTCWARNCHERRRGFEMIMTDFRGKVGWSQVVARFTRPFRCCDCSLCASYSCCSDRITVEAPPGNEIGRVEQRSGCKLEFNLFYWGDRFAYIEGPLTCCTWWLPEKRFKVYSNSNSEIGVITKLFGGIIKEFMTDADTFQVTFPADMSVNAKLVMMGASILIDFIAFEEKAR